MPSPLQRALHFEWMVARRYLAGGRGARRDRFLSAITGIAVAAVAVGVAALVLALAVNAGFREAFEERLLGATAHVSLARSDGSGLGDYRALAEKLEALPGVTTVSPVLYETVLASSGGRARGVVLKGIDPGRASQDKPLLFSVREGTAALSPGADGVGRLLLGAALAEELGVSPGEEVLITSPQGHLTPFGLVPRYRNFRVAGIFESGFWEVDAGWAFTDLGTAQELFRLDDRVSLLELRLQDVYQAESIAREIEPLAGPGMVATTWMEMHQSLFRALRLEKLVTALFLGLVVLVAGLNILVLLVLLGFEKRRDIAVLLSLGARGAQIRRIFVLHGVAIGGLGTLVGLAVGYCLALSAGAWHWFPLDPKVYGIPYVPFRVSPADGVMIAAGAIAISLAATLYPARRAGRLSPVEVLRYE